MDGGTASPPYGMDFGRLPAALVQAADQIAFTAADSDLSLAEHLLDQAAPIRLAMGRMDEAEEAVRQAVRLCEKHPEEDRYLETREGALQFLKEILLMTAEGERINCQSSKKAGENVFM